VHQSTLLSLTGGNPGRGGLWQNAAFEDLLIIPRVHMRGKTTNAQAHSRTFIFVSHVQISAVAGAETLRPCFLFLLLLSGFKRNLIVCSSLVALLLQSAFTSRVAKWQYIQHFPVESFYMDFIWRSRGKVQFQCRRTVRRMAVIMVLTRATLYHE
jgi:hypothetical protein